MDMRVLSPGRAGDKAQDVLALEGRVHNVDAAGVDEVLELLIEIVDLLEGEGGALRRQGTEAHERERSLDNDLKLAVGSHEAFKDSALLDVL